MALLTCCREQSWVASDHRSGEGELSWRPESREDASVACFPHVGQDSYFSPWPYEVPVVQPMSAHTLVLWI